MSHEPGNGKDMYKTATLCLLSALFSMIGAYFIATHNVVTKEELPALIQQNNPYVQDAKDIKNKLDDLRERVIRLDDYQKQIGQDVANVAAKSGVTAHPVTDGDGKRH